jgi:hypothetical protein
MSDPVVDFSDAPTKSGWGEAPDGGILQDPGGNAKKQLENIPVGGNVYKFGKAAVDLVDPPQEYFDGEWWEIMLNSLQQVAKMGEQILEVVGVARGVISANPGDLLGVAAGALAKSALSFLISTVQPIQDLVGILYGNPARLEESADMWKAVAENLEALANEIGPDFEACCNQNWGGQAGAGAHVRGSDLVQTTGFAAMGAGGLHEFLLCYKDLAQGVNDFVLQVVSDVIAVLIAAAVEAGTKGPFAIPFIAADVAILVASYAMRLIQLATQVAWLIIEGLGLMTALSEGFEKAMSVLERLSGYNAPPPIAV